MKKRYKPGFPMPAIRMGRVEPPKNRDTASILRGLDLIRDDRMLNAAVVLFGRDVWSHFSQCEIRLARFRGDDRAGVIERWGSGTTNIIDWCNDNGNYS